MSIAQKAAIFHTVSWFACFETQNAHTINYFGLNPSARCHETHKKCKWSGAFKQYVMWAQAKIPLFGWQEFSATIVQTAFKPIQIHQRCHKFETIKGVNAAGSFCNWIECGMKYCLPSCVPWNGCALRLDQFLLHFSTWQRPNHKIASWDVFRRISHFLFWAISMEWIRIVETKATWTWWEMKVIFIGWKCEFSKDPKKN